MSRFEVDQSRVGGTKADYKEAQATEQAGSLRKHQDIRAPLKSPRLTVW